MATAQGHVERATTGAGALHSFYDRRRGLWKTTGWWNGANALGALIDYMRRSGDRAYVEVVENTFARNRRGRFINEFYDDEGWWALAWLKAYDLTTDGRYLDAARTLFADMCGGWDDVCGGGVWWNKERRYKNAIANELFLKVAARLHQRESGSAGLAWAQRAWAWFSHSGLINERSLVNDGLGPDCRNNGGVTWTYNQGVVLGGLVALYEITHEETLLATAHAIAGAALRSLTNADGILVEPNEPDLGNDGPQFKGIFIRNLRELYDVTQEAHYRDALIANADSIWHNSRREPGFFGVRWTGPFDATDAARQSSALDALNSAMGLAAA